MKFNVEVKGIVDIQHKFSCFINLLNDLSLSLSPVILSPKRFVGYDSEGGELEADRLRHYIYGGHVSDYMKQLQDEDEEKYKAHFSLFIKEGISADNASDYVT